MDPQHKALKGLKITDADEGKVEAVFATLNVKDSDGDVTLPGAFKSGQEVRISAYNHKSWGEALPVGRGVIQEKGDDAILEGQFFLNTTAGRDTFEVVKQMGGLQEWSYGFDTLDSEAGTKDGENVQFLKSLDVHEVSPVLLGAGISTRTLATKGKQKLTDHIKSVLTEVDEVTNRVAEVVTKRTEQGKNLGSESQDLVSEIETRLDRLKSVLSPEPPVADTQIPPDALLEVEQIAARVRDTEVRA